MNDELDILPATISTKLKSLARKIAQVTEYASRHLKNTLPEEGISVEVSSDAGRDVLTPYERAQSVSFISRYEHLPPASSDYFSKSRFSLKMICLAYQFISESLLNNY